MITTTLPSNVYERIQAAIRGQPGPVTEKQIRTFFMVLFGVSKKPTIDKHLEIMLELGMLKAMPPATPGQPPRYTATDVKMPVFQEA